MDAEAPDDVALGIGRRIAEIRQELGLTQEQYAERIDVTKNYIQRIEAGRANPTVSTLVKFAAGLGRPVRDLFDPPSSMERPGPGRPPGS